MALDDLRLASVSYDGVNYCFHYFGVVARVDRGLLQTCVRVVLHGDCLVRVVSSYIFKDLFLLQRLPVFSVAGQPQSGGLSVEIVGDAKIVLPNLANHILATLLLFFLLLRLSEHVIVFVAQVV